MDFENRIRNILSKRDDWKELKLCKKVKHNNKIITDHDIVLYQETKKYVFLLELQLKDKKKIPEYHYESPKNTGLGFLTYNKSRGIQHRQWIGKEDAAAHYTKWFKDHNKIINILDDRSSPVYQIHKSVIDTIGQLKEMPKNIHLPDFKNKQLILCPVIIIGNYSKYQLFLSIFKEDKIKDMSDYLKEVMDIKLNGNLEGKWLTIYIVGDKLLNQFLNRMSLWVENNK